MNEPAFAISDDVVVRADGCDFDCRSMTSVNEWGVSNMVTGIILSFAFTTNELAWTDTSVCAKASAADSAP